MFPDKELAFWRTDLSQTEKLQLLLWTASNTKFNVIMLGIFRDEI